MATWIDVLSFIATAASFAGAVLAILYTVRWFTRLTQSTKDHLQRKGLHVSDHGVSIKTAKRFDREDYVDATQRGFIKAMGAASFGPAGSSTPPRPRAVDRSLSTSSAGSLKKDDNEKEKKGAGIFGMRRPHSGGR